jgi:hypothetical protein
MQAPDYVEPHLGWRVWNVVEADGGLRLSSLVYREVWSTGHDLAARCRRTLAALPWGRMPLHTPPSYECRCGIHAVASPALAASYLGGDGPGGDRVVHRVIGTVSLWGRIVEADRGWRAEYAYPASILVPSRGRDRLVAAVLWPYRPSPSAIADELQAYGVPVDLIETGRLPRRAARASAR